MDAQKITNELLATGLKEHELAALAGCSQSTINAFRHGKRGTRPSLEIGTNLMRIHQERCLQKAPIERHSNEGQPV